MSFIGIGQLLYVIVGQNMAEFTAAEKDGATVFRFKDKSTETNRASTATDIIRMLNGARGSTRLPAPGFSYCGGGGGGGVALCRVSEDAPNTYVVLAAAGGAGGDGQPVKKVIVNGLSF